MGKWMEKAEVISPVMSAKQNEQTNKRGSEVAAIEELVDLRLIHRVKSSVTVGDRPGKKYEAFMLDVSQYTASRKKRDFEIIEFWRSDATDSIRRSGLIYKEFDGNQVVTKGGDAIRPVAPRAT